jgi:hypothetical protein
VSAYAERPWKLSRLGYSVTPSDGGRISAQFAGTKERARATMTLVAAAPDLLESAEAILEARRRGLDADAMEQLWTCLDAAVDRAKGVGWGG